MAQDSPGELLRKWFEVVWNDGRTDLIDQLMSPDHVSNALTETGAASTGPAGFKPFYDRLRGAIPDLKFAVHEVIESGETAAARWTATGTHRGDHLGTKATGNRITMPGMTFLRTANGKMAESWNQWDRLALAVGTGAVAPIK
ncbi:ester cyclase [Limobrevibacterium gyesilva]|uniref:Ester cyclase n=1 Tax=Limobrevibacterium gyesilva TaxID=2991712 RepID=A0AA41YUI1_9PROT|nr:ester cyclase [Limobrevibacterium gyesilva]MCW3476740.1 ester cyclase [Limobrevibacterium gyesilva]